MFDICSYIYLYARWSPRNLFML